MRRYVLSDVRFETSAHLIPVAKPTWSGEIAIDSSAMRAGSAGATRDALPGNPFACHTHPLFAVATSCNSPSSCPTGTDLAADIFNAARTGSALSLTLTTNGVFAVWRTRAALALFSCMDSQERLLTAELLSTAIASEISGRYSLGDAVASLCNEMDLLCEERGERLSLIRRLVDSASSGRRFSAALAGAFRGSNSGNDFASREWTRLARRVCTAGVALKYLKLALRNPTNTSLTSSLEQIAPKLAPFAGSAILDARFFSLREIADEGLIRLPAHSCVGLLPLDRRRPSYGATLRRKFAPKDRTVTEFSRRDFKRMFVSMGASNASDAAEQLSREIWRSILRKRRGYAAERIAAALLRPSRTPFAARECNVNGVLHSCIDLKLLKASGVLPPGRMRKILKSRLT